jgi:SAM-dependent methyltransferase
MLADEHDEQNLLWAASADAERRVADFYDAFPYPWKAWIADAPHDPDLYRVHLCQDVGDWSHHRISASPRIWVAGCGTNQAVITALRFPDSFVLGSDLSETALQAEAEQAQELGVRNLKLELRSINDSGYNGEFEYIICTGVAHHNPQPEITLQRLSTALTETGVLELMVYNRFHRLWTGTFQKAAGLLLGSGDGLAPEDLVAATRNLAAALPQDNLLARGLAPYVAGPDADFVDALANPIERSYTVMSLAALAESAGLRLLLPKPTDLDFVDDRYLWRLQFADAGLQARFDQLPDLQRWQLVNLFAFDRSPMLWFYLERTGAHSGVSSTVDVNSEFLRHRFSRSDGTATRYVRDVTSGHYAAKDRPSSLAAGAVDADAGRLLQLADGRRSMGELVAEVGIEPTARNVDRLRIHLCSSARPRLRAVGR